MVTERMRASFQAVKHACLRMRPCIAPKNILCVCKPRQCPQLHGPSPHAAPHLASCAAHVLGHAMTVGRLATAWRTNHKLPKWHYPSVPLTCFSVFESYPRQFSMQSFRRFGRGMRAAGMCNSPRHISEQTASICYRSTNCTIPVMQFRLLKKFLFGVTKIPPTIRRAPAPQTAHLTAHKVGFYIGSLTTAVWTDFGNVASRKPQGTMCRDKIFPAGSASAF